MEGKSGLGSTFVFGHGFGNDQTAWDAVKMPFGQRNDMVLYDNIGVGTTHPVFYAVPEEVAYYLNSRIKGSSFRIVDAEGHFPHISAPDSTIKEVTVFMNS